MESPRASVRPHVGRRCIRLAGGAGQVWAQRVWPPGQTQRQCAKTYRRNQAVCRASRRSLPLLNGGRHRRIAAAVPAASNTVEAENVSPRTPRSEGPVKLGGGELAVFAGTGVRRTALVQRSA